MFLPSASTPSGLLSAHQAETPDAGQSLAAHTPPADMLAATPPLSTGLTPRPFPSAGLQLASDPQFAFADLADYPTSTSVPVPPVSSPIATTPDISAQFAPGFGFADQGSSMASAGQTNADEVHAFVRPLPRWLILGGPLAGAALLAGLVFLNTDWATGATIAAMVAIMLAILLGIATGVRVALGLLQATNPRRRSQMLSTALLVLLLLLVSGLGIGQQNNLHLMQGHYLEGHQSWAAAIQAYQAGGERSSSSADVARTYVEWGQAQIKQQDYAGAVTSFQTVLTHYQPVTGAVKQARTGLITAYLGWADQAARQQNYAGAVAHYNALLSLTFCDAPCARQASSKNATAYYHLAEQQLTQQHYIQAVDAYQTLATRFPDAPEAGQIHAHYAQALWGKGQQLLQSACADALAAYRLLTSQFADTAEGKQAASALTKPVPVKGRFTQPVPGSPYRPAAYLVQGLVVGIQQYQFPPLLAHAPEASIQGDGTFTFASVPQGTYELVWSSDNALHFYYSYSGKQVLYVAHVGPLCAFDYGDINQAIPVN
ncbi:MAG TPA: hypothetical protein VHD63_14565 [Ktedonobacteraceae bacterium]|nr:hypothetical protein [Ktedonobacteraceae bacterium]